MNLNRQQKIRIGACAWSFEDWREIFYPRDLPESRWLEFYARYFPTVEIDSTLRGSGRGFGTALARPHSFAFSFFLQTAPRDHAPMQAARLRGRVERVSARG